LATARAAVRYTASKMRTTLCLRPAAPSDESWLEALRRAVYQELFVTTFGAWDEARHARQWAECWARGHISIVEFAGEPVGMIQLYERPDAVEVGEVQVLPRFQNRGIGSQLLRDTVARAHARGERVLLAVARNNDGAYRLYLRLGFADVSQSETHNQMACHAP
jgi:ribosomal protein S18 acetylase RimI-like enzyme